MHIYMQCWKSNLFLSFLAEILMRMHNFYIKSKYDERFIYLCPAINIISLLWDRYLTFHLLRNEHFHYSRQFKYSYSHRVTQILLFYIHSEDRLMLYDCNVESQMIADTKKFTPSILPQHTFFASSKRPHQTSLQQSFIFRTVYSDSENEWTDNAAGSDERERTWAAAFKLAGTNEQTECAPGMERDGGSETGKERDASGCIISVSSHYEERSSVRNPERIGSLSFN